MLSVSRILLRLLSHLPCYLVPSSRVRLLVITMTIFLQVSRSLAEPHSSVSVQFVMALMSSSQRARCLPFFLLPPPIRNIIDFSKLFSLCMICPKYDICCFFMLPETVNSSSLCFSYRPGFTTIQHYWET